jgi:hypothetical protein
MSQAKYYSPKIRRDLVSKLLLAGTVNSVLDAGSTAQPVLLLKTSFYPTPDK